MKQINISDKMKFILDPKKSRIAARLFVTREDGITIYDSVQDATTTSVSALVSGVWQASEALMGLVNKSQDVMDFRLGFDTSSQGIYLFPFQLFEKRYFLGAIYHECLNPAQLKRQVAVIKEELEKVLREEKPKDDNPGPPKLPKQDSNREGFLFQEITDEEIDRLFSVGGL
ncbi:MAG TPA: hypothetical protein VNJ01_13160 [Bacteriovoracaceae bacterium]|nr:hypothetical protein [Bacteriovoracaceae bacterium]